MMARRDRGDPLEIKDYVGALAGKGRIVAAVAIIVGFLAVVVFILEPQHYSAKATVVIPTPPSTTTSALAAVSQAYADFAGALGTDVVAEKVAADVGVPKSAVKGHVSATREAGSAIAEVTYSGTDKDHATLIAQMASQDALEVIISARLAPLDEQVSLAQSAYDTTISLYQQFVSDTGIVNGTQYFRQQSNHLINLNNLLGTASKNGDQAEITRLEGLITEKKTTLSQQVADYQRLIATRESALEALQGAQSNELSEKGLLDSVTAGGQVKPSTNPSSAPRLSGLIKAVVPAVVVASGLAILVIVLLEVVGPVRLPSRRRAGDGGSNAEVDDVDDGEVERLEESGDPKRNVGSTA
jgi:capsular polysaccharide biosynthesis protein